MGLIYGIFDDSVSSLLLHMSLAFKDLAHEGPVVGDSPLRHFMAFIAVGMLTFNGPIFFEPLGVPQIICGLCDDKVSPLGQTIPHHIPIGPNRLEPRNIIRHMGILCDDEVSSLGRFIYIYIYRCGAYLHLDHHPCASGDHFG